MKTAALVCSLFPLLVSCEKKEEAPAAPSAAPEAPPPVAATPPPPAASIPPVASAAPAVSAAPSAEAANTAAAAEGSAAAAAGSAPAASASAEPEKKVAAPSLKSCCAALATEGKKPGKDRNRYTAAAAVCNGLDAQLKKGAANLAAAKVTLKAQLAGVTVPPGC